ncbi:MULTISPECIES: alpha/beta hydrolase [unclassified Curtobacterium]|uniref:alpha/beta hydrolase n=1 Tax=unclassified Curtobacterium TaxID=257496 RepID=UPI003A8024AE
MALTTLSFLSSFLRSNQTISVILPDLPLGANAQDFYSSGKRYPVLWLLHGTFGDHTDWVRRTNIETYATEAQMVVVMPSALNSNYSNWPNFSLGYDANRYLVDELLPLIHGWFPVSSAREDNAIAGLSMGGRGTMKFVANNPERFGRAAVFSAAPRELDALDEHEVRTSADPFLQRLAGMADNAGGWRAFVDGDENVWRIFDERRNELPPILFSTGGADQLIRDDLARYREHAEATGLNMRFEEIPGLGHEWRFWDESIRRAMPFLSGQAND